MKRNAWSALFLLSAFGASAFAAEPAWWTNQKRMCGLRADLAYNTWESQGRPCPRQNQTGGGGMSNLQQQQLDLAGQLGSAIGQAFGQAVFGNPQEQEAQRRAQEAALQADIQRAREEEIRRHDEIRTRLLDGLRGMEATTQLQTGRDNAFDNSSGLAFKFDNESSLTAPNASSTPSAEGSGNLPFKFDSLAVVPPTLPGNTRLPAQPRLDNIYVPANDPLTSEILGCNGNISCLAKINARQCNGDFYCLTGVRVEQASQWTRQQWDDVRTWYNDPSHRGAVHDAVLMATLPLAVADTAVLALAPLRVAGTEAFLLARNARTVLEEGGALLTEAKAAVGAPSALLRAEGATELEFNFVGALGGRPKPDYPLNDGFLGERLRRHAIPGEEWERIAVNFEHLRNGRFMSPEGTPFVQRALEPRSDYQLYRLRVEKEFDLDVGSIKEWFGWENKGWAPHDPKYLQGYVGKDRTIGQLIDQGYLRWVPDIPEFGRGRQLNLF